MMQDLYLELKAELQEIDQEASNVIQRAERSYRVASGKLQQLKTRRRDVHFDEQQEILYFKEVKPQFLKELIFHSEVYHIETNKPVASKEFQKTYYSQSLAGVGFFFERNLSLYNYFRLGRTDLDEVFFKAQGGETDPLELVPGYLPGLDSEVNELYSYKLGKLQAFELVHDFLSGALAGLDGTAVWPEPMVQQELVWTDSKSAFIELVYALIASRSINRGKVQVKALMNGLGRLLNVDAGNFYRVLQGQRIRKIRTPYTSSLPVNLEKFMDDTDIR
ncbi:MAG: RteC domain-containing protein [Candidatus Pseudobacter hemicellulosilyticus]|uniref:RteC domain-containing protein n=1 Tax=Candidatus Pseudobacter hemicellulosilyticus TaxID=3121375 RepID=A0AAJ5WQ49_9BACT|nr:MAG: RteC domain-containing protein [Pseudobacter sp.]